VKEGEEGEYFHLVWIVSCEEGLVLEGVELICGINVVYVQGA